MYNFMYDITSEDDDWVSRKEAAEIMRCSPDRISCIVKEMEELGWEGVWLESGRFYRINMKALKDYLYHRNKIKADKRYGRSK